MRIVAGLAAVLTIGGLGATATEASVLVVGDSLGVGTEPALRGALGDADLEADNENGRTSTGGLSVLQERLRPEHDTIVFDLGTNDGPTAVVATAANLAAVRELAGGRCLVVATLNHPPVGGVGIAAQNASIERFALETPNAALVDWHAAARSTPGALRPDGVHATSSGYASRGALFADAIASCLAGGSDSRGGGTQPAGPAASATRRPADRRDATAGADGDANGGLVELVAERLRQGGGPVALARKAAAAISTASAHLGAALTARGPEPVLGAPDRPL